MTALCDDLAAEHAALDAVVAELDEARWDRPTPAEGWAVREQISHLAYSDVAAYRAAVDPEAFARDITAVRRGERQQRQLAVGRAMSSSPWITGSGLAHPVTGGAYAGAPIRGKSVRLCGSWSRRA